MGKRHLKKKNVNMYTASSQAYQNLLNNKIKVEL